MKIRQPNERRNLAIKIGVVLCLGTIFLIGFFLSQDKLKQVEKGDSQPEPLPKPVPPKEALPDYKVLARNVIDNPEKVEVDLSVLVKDEMSRESISRLINQIYSEESDSEGFKNRSHATHIRVTVYQSEEAYKENSWIAQLTRLGEHEPPWIDFNEDKEQRVPIQIRKQIYSEIKKEEMAAYKAAEKKYPLPKDLEKQVAFMDQEVERVKKEIAAKHEITRNELDKISNDWTLESWEKD